ncbi:MAG: 3-phosphoglycerate dehydrogenase family protein [Thermodesulfobacteriota bacterium]
MRIKVINKIAQEGLNLFSENYTVGSAVEDPEGIVVRSSQVDVDDYPSLLAVARAGAGVNNITVARATELGICVFNTPGANANAVAELVMVMAGMGARNIVQAIQFCQGLAGMSENEIQGEVEGRKSDFRGMELAGKTLGVLGLGQIGVLVANKGVRQQMRTMAYDPSPALENIHRLSAQVSLSRSLSTLLAAAHVLTVHVPLTDKTRGIVDSTLLAQLPDGAMLINYSRGAVVVEEDVRDALDSGKLSLYITDFPSVELLGHPLVLSTPHLGASTEESEEQCASMAVTELVDYLQFGSVVRSVNFPTVESIPGGQVHSRLIMINRDTPGMIGFASQTLGNDGINIASYLNESNGVIGYNIIDLESPVSAETLAKIQSHDDVIRLRTIAF